MAVVINEFEASACNVLTQLDMINNFETVIGGNSIGMGEDGQFLVKLHPARWSRCARSKIGLFQAADPRYSHSTNHGSFWRSWVHHCWRRTQKRGLTTASW